MKVLVFEYITGGGLCREELPPSLAAEGLLMLKALLRDLSELDGVETVLLLDIRLIGQVSIRDNVSLVEIDQSGDFRNILESQLDGCDAVWPVAPEMDNILFDLTRLSEKHHKPVLSSPSEAVALTTDKLATYRQLIAHRIDAVQTEMLQCAESPRNAKRVIKPIDGMGCEQTFILAGPDDLAKLAPQINASDRYIMQPFIEGQPKSLSCLFKSGKGWLLSINKQIIQIADQRFKLIACQVNEQQAITEVYRQLVDRIAAAFPEMWGYAGIDFIETTQGLAVLEINPRLTTSYAGIHQALGINIAEQVLSMLQHDPVPRPTENKTITVSIEGQG